MNEREQRMNIYHHYGVKQNVILIVNIIHTVCPRSSDPFFKVTYYKKWVTTSCTDGMCKIGRRSTDPF